MLVILDDLREVVVQGIGIAVLCPEIVAVEVCRLVLDGRCIAYIIGCETIETVVFLRIVVETAFNLQVEIVDDMSCNCTVKSPVLTDTATVVVSNRLERRSVVAIVFLKVRIRGCTGNRDRSILHCMFQTCRST